MTRSLLLRLVLLALAGCSKSSSPDPATSSPEAIVPKNVTFLPPPADPAAVPAVRSIRVPDFPNAAAIWGATGHDAAGHLWFGVSCEGGEAPSARLFEFGPETSERFDRGDAVAQLNRLGLARPGERQQKIHTKIWQMPDGYLYFASMDEDGEKSDGSRLPTFGSHLWRVKPGGSEWEHLAAVPEAVIAAAVGGRFVYFLGYYGHVLFQLDPGTRKLASVKVGSAGGHVSRNFLADANGHAYVPRVVGAKAELVEFDAELRELRAVPLPHYTTTPDETSHGIIGWQPLADGTIAFVTDQGRLHRVEPAAGGPALVADLGWFHPKGATYSPSLFTHDGKGHVVGAAQTPGGDGRTYDWVSFDLTTRRSQARPLAVPAPVSGVWQDLLMYGSITRDDAGRAYLVGRYTTPGPEKSWPAIWQLSR